MASSYGSPPWVPRVLDLPRILAGKSYFLLGPRQTGKTSLLRAALPEARVYDLLDSAVYLALSQRPERLGEEIGFSYSRPRAPTISGAVSGSGKGS